jgi:uncharacterized protein YcfL
MKKAKLLILSVACLFSLVSCSSKTATNNNNNAGEVVIVSGSLKLTSTKEYDASYFYELTGTVQNQTGYSLEDIYIEANVYDAAGTILNWSNTISSIVQNLEKWSFSIIGYCSAFPKTAKVTKIQWTKQY